MQQTITTQLLAVMCLVTAPLLAGAGVKDDDAAQKAQELRAEIVAMKEALRGPFRRIRWFCEDGAVLAPEPFACAEHGGGRQHGEWSDAATRVRAAGYPIANLLADLGPDDVLGEPGKERHLRMLLLEQFLIAADDGWILRRARFYRGAFQIEDEIAGARRILEGLADQPKWHGAHYTLLVEATRLLPAEEQPASAAAVRGLATAINERDPDFLDLRTKIHNRPGVSDAAAVRDYASHSDMTELAERYQELAAGIDALYARPDPLARLREATRLGLSSKMLDGGASRLAAAADKRSAVGILCELMASIRDDMSGIDSPHDRVEAVRLILELEAQVFARSQPVLAAMETDATASRADRIGLLLDFTGALYGIGLLGDFERQQIRARLAILDTGQANLANYRDALAGLDRLPGWAGRRLGFFFEDLIAEFAPLEPLSREYIPDRLRGSPLLHFGLVLRSLATDASLLSGATSELFGRATVTGLRRLNPGVGRGVLRRIEQLDPLAGDANDSIVIVPQTIAELPAVAGIITAQEGNALSHVQLLARNLGIPNVVVGESLLPELYTHTGSRVELSATPGGIVRLRDLPANATATRASAPRLTLDIDVDKLDLDTRHLIATSDLTQADSGVRVGPKAAQLGELTVRFPGDVSPGLAIPFGVFRSVLDLPREAGGDSTFAWMKSTYRTLASIDDPSLRARQTNAFLAELRSWIENIELDPALVARMKRKMVEHFGQDGSFGVFVRSDTNIEDLPGFTGAGLNLTVANVTGTDPIIAAIKKVWASPFTERAYGWRQALMKEPEHVYAAVLLHASVNADKSGVLITADIETGSREYITVVVNEGVGGGVDGQSAETLRISLADGAVVLLNSASTATKRVLLGTGGSALVAASGEERLLTKPEIDALRRFTRRVSRWFTNVPEEERENVIADVEFGFFDGRLVLFQIRPFVQSQRMLGDPYLTGLDDQLARTASLPVDMSAAPGREPSR